MLTRRLISRKVGIVLTRVVNPAPARWIITPTLKLFDRLRSSSESVGDVGTETALSLVECLTNELAWSECLLCLESVVECLSARFCEEVFTMGFKTARWNLRKKDYDGRNRDKKRTSSILFPPCALILDFA